MKDKKKNEDNLPAETNTKLSKSIEIPTGVSKEAEDFLSTLKKKKTDPSDIATMLESWLEGE